MTLLQAILYWFQHRNDPGMCQERIRYTVSSDSGFITRIRLKEYLRELNQAQSRIFYEHIDTKGEIEIHSGAFRGFPFDENTLAYTLVCRDKSTGAECADIFFKESVVNSEVFDFKTVLWHELLHSANVEHHRDPRGLMFASYVEAKDSLHSSDLRAIDRALA